MTEEHPGGATEQAIENKRQQLRKEMKAGGRFESHFRTANGLRP